MKTEEIINNWNEQRNRIEVGENFTKDVMNQVYQYERLKRKPLFDMQRLIELISAHPLAKAALIATGAVAGVVRIVFMIIVILNKGVING
ncbi:MAG: hypothetical protein ACYSQZ_09505 [Planctomycetota bacterium]|jgi:hypothetical protein